MTEGSISKKIILFALPVFLGNLCQQFYNVADSLVVGNVLGKEALASVSSAGSLIFMLIGFVQGLFLGAGVIISQYYGAKRDADVSSITHTTVTFAFVAGLILSVIGICFTPTFLRLMDTPADVIEGSVIYFRVYFMGSIFSTVYNACCSAFQAVGDSRHPLYYLVTSALVNIALDILFVRFFGMGIAGAAFATVLSQAISAALSFGKLLKVAGPHKIILKKLGINFSLLKKILKMGIPTGVQNSVIGFANVIVQSNINAFGSDAMAGCGTYFKLEGFAFLPITSFCAALTTFIGQNLGAGQVKRAKQGARFGIVSGVLLAQFVGIILFVFSPQLVYLFNQDEKVIAIGTLQARTECLFYFLLSASHCLAAILRGAGKTRVPMFVMLACWCVIRITYLHFAVPVWPRINTICMAYPITWGLSTVIFIIYYVKAKWAENFEKTVA